MNRACVLRRALLAMVASSLCLAAWAQPAPVRLLVGYAAGGPVDAAARLLAPALAKELGQPVQVENKPGANATLAGDAVARAAPDGLTLWFAASPPLTIGPHVMKKMPFDPARDITPVAPLVNYSNVLVVHKDVPAQSLKELVALAKAQPGKLSFGSAGIGSSNHLSGELLAQRTGTQLLHVPYKGSGPAMSDLIGGQLTMMFDILSTARGHIASGRVRAIALSAGRRSAALPEVPTMAEAGLPGFDVGGWYALYAPNKLPPAVAARLLDATRKALAQPELAKALAEQGYDAWTGSPEQVAQRAATERTQWASVTQGISID
ncbi:Bug family tripartite tricarboxylate transporter substrate binding protein [Aquabacterium sp. OR-4]|uniref:Bug family tripartite tricarboxylate transporter substrate binding protein n=1 Tax=Aquabacterium sp. OR-4 TaxID=2978127 RepID=UPI0021B438FE|nr:tripartite tricarboxylate transporter substrate binding protein [Aquabacterium sp. OR-4]MDT7838419.1 tripartite tricarboxylate transporter substrate binding protein [Aquabacterium sp. OR-4]